MNNNAGKSILLALFYDFISYQKITHRVYKLDENVLFKGCEAFYIWCGSFKQL